LSRRRLRVRISRRTIIGIAALVVLTIVGGWWRATSIINRLLRDWAVGVVAQESDSVYRLEPVGVHVNWLLRRVIVDSARLTTNQGVNASQRPPFAEVRINLSRCSIVGVHVITLVRGAGLIARSMGCGTGSIAVAIPRRAEDSTAAFPTDSAPRDVRRTGFLVLQQGVRLPSYLRRIEIRRVTFPDLAFDFRIPRARRGETRLELERLQWGMTDFVIDPADPLAGSRPLFSRTIELVANNFVAHPDSTTTLRIGLLRASLTDSTLEARGIGADFGLAGAFRHDRIKLRVARTLLVGVDFGALAFGLGARAHRVMVDSLGIDVTNDKRLPPNPQRQRRRSPQQWMADFDLAFRMDTVVVHSGEIVYREHSAGRTRPGVMTFAGIQATAANVTHLDRRRVIDTMTLAATARLQDTALVEAQFAIPLDAPQFDMTFRGTVGAMPATALNPFIEEVFPLRIANGRVAKVSFGAQVLAGVARGSITPRFADLSVSVTRRGSGGILGGGGVLGGVARGIASFVANRWEVRDKNPDNPTKSPKSGRIRYTFRSDQALPAFLWGSLREGLLQVVKQ
jgi:hypothetical protein